MFKQSRDVYPTILKEEFNRPVESIMRCEDFKSNFARRLSNRYISRSSVSSPRQDTALKLRPLHNNSEEIPDNVPERIEPCPQLSKNSNMEQNGEAVKPPDKTTLKNSDIQRTEVNALNMEVETLRWQLAQTEANRQMHIALLKQIVTFLNRVKEHIESQKNESELRKEALSTRVLPRSFNTADLPRSRSVLHVNRNPEYYNISPAKKISAKMINKSISNVNDYKDCNGVWSQSKLSLAPETEAAQKITEEMSRLITLANTVLSTKLPDLACTCNDKLNKTNTKQMEQVEREEEQNQTPNREPQNESTSLNQIEEDISSAFILSTTTCDGTLAYSGITKQFIEVKDKNINDFIVSPSPLTCGLENDFACVKLDSKEQKFSPMKSLKESTDGKNKTTVDKKNDYNHASNFIEDESGFSSMSSFQEIGIPIISIIPPSPCKDVGFMEEIPDIINETEKWKTDAIELDKQTVKVFWV